MVTLTDAIEAVATRMAAEAHSNFLGGSLNGWYEVGSPHYAAVALAVVYDGNIREIEDAIADRSRDIFEEKY